MRQRQSFERMQAALLIVVAYAIVCKYVLKYEWFAQDNLGAAMSATRAGNASPSERPAHRVPCVASLQRAAISCRAVRCLLLTGFLCCSYIRHDSLAQLLTYANVRAGMDMLVVESCSGFITGAIGERMGGTCVLVRV